MFLLQLAGDPGSGKSTLARLLGRASGAVVIDKDVLKSAMLEAGVNETLAASAAYDSMFSLAEHLLGQGFSVILDSPAYYESIPRQGAAIAARFDARYCFICCVCADGNETRRRLASRARLRSQLIEPVSPDTRTRFPETPALSIDTIQSPDSCLALALEYLRTGPGPRPMR